MDKIRTVVSFGEEKFKFRDKEEYKEQKYSCACGAHDTYRYPVRLSSGIPHVINCWKCHAGMGLSPEDMLSKGEGMSPNQIGSD